MTESKSKSLFAMILAMIIFGSIGIFRRYIPMSSAVLACFRGFSGAFLLLLICIVRKTRLNFRIGFKSFILFAITGILIGINWILLFEAYNYTSVSTATMCYYMQPAIIVLVSPLFLREKFTLKSFICITASVTGMIMISGIIENGLPEAGDTAGILLSLSAAVVYAAVILLNKKLPDTGIYEKTIIQLLSASAAIIPYLIISRQTVFLPLSASEFILMLTVGFIHTGVAYALYFSALKGLNAQTAAFLSYIDPVTALLLSVAVLNESMNIYSIAGAVLIIGSAVIKTAGRT